MGFLSDINAYPNVIFSDNPEIKNVQEVVEQLKLHDAIKNIVNEGNPNRDDEGTIEWETCKLYYKPSISVSNISSEVNEKIIIGSIYLQKNECLYESHAKKAPRGSSLSAVIAASQCKNSYTHRYTECFRQGKWVHRLLKHSEELTQRYLEQEEKKKLQKQEEKKKPFLDIDF